MNRIIIFITFLFISSIINAQVYKFISTKNNITDNNFKVTTYNQTTYLTFDYNKKIITVKIMKPSSSAYDIFEFKMISFEKYDSPVLGPVYLIYVQGNLPQLRGIETFKFKPSGTSIWVDSEGATITFAVKPL